ncbi:MAG: hypothetical protein HUU54_05250 [Ignavibacteriaceae bacterium]|nr:hypothetical protein [Ignavibacteriaceae bacterium]
MKKISCLAKLIGLLTVASVVFFYIATHHYEEYIATPVKKFFLNMVIGDIDKELLAVKNSYEKEILVNELKQFNSFVLSQNVINLDSLKSVAETVGTSFIDSAITKDELSKILTLINKYKDERRKKN